MKSSLAQLLFFACALIALPAVSQGQVSVWLQSPKPGSSPSQISVYASATSPHGISRWAIYVDDVPAYQVTSYSDTLSHTMSLSKGTHLLYARAWDSAGGGLGTSATLLMQVGSAPSGNPVLPTPPSYATVLLEMQNTTSGWKDCSICAQGTNDTTNFWMAPFQTSPSMSGSSRELFAGGLAWTNVLFIKTMSGASTASHFLWDFWVYHDSPSATNIWSAEFDLWQVLGGTEFMIGSQCDFGDGYWDTWDNANNRWITNGIACPRWAPNTWHHIQWYVQRLTGGKYRYNTLVVDGRGYGLNQVWMAKPSTWPDAIGIQYQLDQDATGTPLHQWIDNVKLTYW